MARTPLLPFDAVSPLPAPRTRAEGRVWLAALLRRPEVREAIHLGSPRVGTAVGQWLADPESDASRRMEPVLVSYVLRAAGRATPFGLFAGWTTGAVGPPGSTTVLRLQPTARYRRHSHLDMEYLVAVAEAIGRDRALRHALPHHPNSSLHEAGDRLHLAESRSHQGRRRYHLVAVEPTAYLRATLERAGSNGPGRGVALDELAGALVDDDIGAEEAGSYIDELVDRQVLVPDLGPALSSPDPGLHLAGRLETAPATAPLARALVDAHLALAEVDEQPLGGETPPAERYAAVNAALRTLPGAVPDHGLVRVDLEKPADEAVLGPEVVAVIEAGIEVLHRLALPEDDPGLTRFRNEFVERYDTRKIPLVEALDDEVGIGFERMESPAADAPDLLGDIPFPPAPYSVAATEAETRRDAVLVRLLGAALWARSPEIELSATDIAELEAAAGGERRPLPGAMAAIARLAARSAADLAAGRFTLDLRFAGGPSGAQLLGRLATVDKTLRAGVESHFRAEEARVPDAVFAEIIHLPEGAFGNVLVRPGLRRYEIPFLGQSAAPPDAQIPVGDLLVSVRDGRIVVESASLGVEVLPRLTSAHFHSRPGVPVYRFLARLQHQGVAGELGWDWGGLGNAPFLPRVVSGRVVLSPARWHVSGRDLARFRAGAPERTAAVAAWRAEWGVPRFVALLDDEDELVVDLDSELALDAVAHHLRNRKAATFAEMFPGPQELCVSGPEGSFVHDLIVPFVTRSGDLADPAIERPQRPDHHMDRVRRRFPPGSEWLYAKLYTGPATADRVLSAAVAPLVAEARASGAADRWFFVRYADPEPHLRLRFGGRADRLQAEVRPALEAVAARLLDEGLAWRLQLDTYEREVERYGGAAAIELIEEIFGADSEAVLHILATPGVPTVPHVRWRAALAGVDRLVADLRLGPDEQRRLATDSCAGYGAEFDVDGRFRQAVSNRFRQERAGLDHLLAATRGDEQPSSPEWAAVCAAFERRSERIGPLAADLRSLAAVGRLSVTLEELAAGLAHMHVNRLLRAAPRAQELVIYEFLGRLWASRAARNPAGGPDRYR